MAGLGAWVEGTYDDLAKGIAEQTNPAELDATVIEKFKRENLKIGDTFCQVARSTRAAGIADREKAMATLAGFRFGVDIVFDAVKKIPVVSAAESALDATTAGAGGKISGQGEEALKSKIAGWWSGVDAEEEAAKSKALTKDNVTALNGIFFDRSMDALGKHPMVLAKLLADNPAPKDPNDPRQIVGWPPAMLITKDNPVPITPLPTDPTYLRNYLKPEYIAEDGSVMFPAPGDPAYSSYRDWCTLDWNRVSERALSMSEIGSARMHGCMVEVGWIEAA